MGEHELSDIHDYARRHEQAVEKLAQSSLTVGDKNLITRFVEYKGAEKVGVERQEKYLRILRVIGENFLGGSTYSSLTKEDVVRIVSGIERQPWTDWTKHDYRLILKTFVTWLGNPEAVEWVKVVKPKGLPDELLTEEDVQALINAALNRAIEHSLRCCMRADSVWGELGIMRLKDPSFDRWGGLANALDLRTHVRPRSGRRPAEDVWADTGYDGE